MKTIPFSRVFPVIMASAACFAAFPGSSWAACGGTLGDMNGDGALNGLDAQGFVNCLTGASSSCDCADMNASGAADIADLPGFVSTLLTGGQTRPDKLQVSIQYSPPMVATTINRCIAFELYTTGQPNPQLVTQQIDFTNGIATDVVVPIPPGTYEKVCARDPEHTVRQKDDATRTFRVSGDRYIADFTGNPSTGGNWLYVGDVNRDGVIELLDFNAISSRRDTNYGTGDSTCQIGEIHADLNGDGIVDTTDEGIVQSNFLRRNRCP